MPFSASYDRTTKIISLVVCLGFLAVIFAVHSVALVCLSLAVMFVAYAYSPRGYVIEGRAILVKRLAGTVRIALDNGYEARRTTTDDFRGCIRLWGSGGLFGYYGLFSTAKLGKSTWYVTNRKNGVVLITGSKTTLLSPDDPDRFLAAVQSAAPAGSYTAPAFDAPRRSGTLGIAMSLAVAVGVLGLVVAAITYSPGPPSYTLTPEALTIHDRFYPVTLPAASVDVYQIRIVDLDRDSEWRPTQRTNGFANSHYQSGWFRVANGQKLRLYRSGGQRLVLLPPRSDGASVLYQAEDPDGFASAVRAAWTGQAQALGNAGK